MEEISIFEFQLLRTMTRGNQLEEIRQAIKTLESFEEKTTESFRIVINTLKQKEIVVEKKLLKPEK